MTHDLWEMVKTNTGLIRDWMVVGPFPISNIDFSDEVTPLGFDEVYPH